MWVCEYVFTYEWFACGVVDKRRSIVIDTVLS